MKFYFFIIILSFSFFSFGQKANLIVDWISGPDSGISEDATVLGTLGDAIIINNQTDILFSDGTAEGTRTIYDLSNSLIVLGEVYIGDELFLAEYTSTDTARIIKISNMGNVDIVLEESGVIELHLGYKGNLYYDHRKNFLEYFYSFDPNTENIQEVIELDWFKRNGLKDAAIFNDLIYMIVWPEQMTGSFLATYDGEGNITFLNNLFSSNVDQSSRSTINMTVADSNLFFWFGDGNNDSALYVTNGTEEGIEILNTEFKRTSRSKSSRTIGTIGNKLLFEGVDINNDRHLWSSDGTILGTFKIEQISGIDITPRYFTEFNSRLSFCGYHGSQPFSAPDLSTLETDGTLDGTITLLDPNEIPGPPITNGYWLNVHNDSLFMVGRKINFPFDNDLYKSDGTPDGTVKVSSIGDQSGNEISHLTSANNNLFFFGTTDDLGKELYAYTLPAIDEDEDGFSSDVDCDDTNPNINPDQNEEPYNGIDDDCDSTTFDDDLDQDGFLLVDDCDDNNPNINPNAEEIPNNDIDEDCDGLDLVSSIHELSNTRINIYPNPVYDKLKIDVKGQLSFSVSLYDLQGKLVKSALNLHEVEVEGTASGIYLIEIKDLVSGHKVIERIVIKQ